MTAYQSLKKKNRVAARNVISPVAIPANLNQTIIVTTGPTELACSCGLQNDRFGSVAASQQCITWAAAFGCIADIRQKSKSVWIERETSLASSSTAA